MYCLIQLIFPSSSVLALVPAWSPLSWFGELPKTEKGEYVSKSQWETSVCTCKCKEPYVFLNCWNVNKKYLCNTACLLCLSSNLWYFFLLQDPSGHSPYSWCPDVLAMAPWANPLNCWPTASKLKSQRLMSTSMRWISNQISVLGGWTGKKVKFVCKLYQYWNF